ncbi:MAG: hypothetical protein PHX30_04150 [Candidatus Pacebacteria bacterium]|jgi:hypothetical protein|nr:hypothetical protein [Candidatus Paceibacterota bacterium]
MKKIKRPRTKIYGFDPREAARIETALLKAHFERDYVLLETLMAKLFEELYGLDATIAEKLAIKEIKAFGAHNEAENPDISKKDKGIYWNQVKELKQEYFHILAEVLKKYGINLSTKEIDTLAELEEEWWELHHIKDYEGVTNCKAKQNVILFKLPLPTAREVAEISVEAIKKYDTAKLLPTEENQPYWIETEKAEIKFYNLFKGRTAKNISKRLSSLFFI